MWSSGARSLTVAAKALEPNAHGDARGREAKDDLALIQSRSVRARSRAALRLTRSSPSRSATPSMRSAQSVRPRRDAHARESWSALGRADLGAKRIEDNGCDPDGRRFEPRAKLGPVRCSTERRQVIGVNSQIASEAGQPQSGHRPGRDRRGFAVSSRTPSATAVTDDRGGQQAVSSEIQSAGPAKKGVGLKGKKRKRNRRLALARAADGPAAKVEAGAEGNEAEGVGGSGGQGEGREGRSRNRAVMGGGGRVAPPPGPPPRDGRNA